MIHQIRAFIFLTITLCSFSGLAQSVLFLGNSLTSTNDLPSIVQYIAKTYDIELKTTAICHPNYAIEDHLDDGVFQKYIKKNKVDYVVFQQGPSSQEEGRKMLKDSGSRIVTLCKKYDCTPAYLMVWPAMQYYNTFDAVIKNHIEAAQYNRTMLISAGSNWKKHHIKTQSYNLYSNDFFHPSNLGSFLTALTIFHSLFPERDIDQLDHKLFSKWIVSQKQLDTITQTVLSE